MNSELMKDLEKLAEQLEGLADELEASAAEVNTENEPEEKIADETKEAQEEISDDSFGKVSEVPGKSGNAFLDFIMT